MNNLCFSYISLLLKKIGNIFLAFFLVQFCLAICSFTIFDFASGQTVEAKNGALILTVPGAQMTLTSTTDDSNTTGNTGAVSIASQQDLASAINNSLTALQPQLVLLNQNINTMNQKVQNEQLRAMSAESAENTRSLLAENNILQNLNQNQIITQNSFTLLQGNLVAEHDRAVLAENILMQNAVNISAVQQRAALAEVTLGAVITQASMTVFQNKIDQSNAVFIVRSDASNAVFQLSNVITQNKIDSSNAVFYAKLDTSSAINAVNVAQTQLLQAQQAILQMNFSQQSLNNKVNVMIACATVGLFVDGLTGLCVAKNTSSALTGMSSCPSGNNGSVSIVKCFPGFAPTGSSASICGSSDTYPTIFQCSGIFFQWLLIFFYFYLLFDALIE